MVYKLNVTDHADELLDNLVYHLIYRLKNKEAAKHLLDGVESIYDRLVENPYQFPKSRDMYLAKKGYYEAVIPQMNYIVIFYRKITDIPMEILIMPAAYWERNRGSF